MTERPTPESTRREGIPASPVRLADGREWGLALPTVRLTPRVGVLPDELGRPVERISVDLGFGYPVEIQRLLDRVQAASEGAPVAEQYEAFFTLAASLLRRAHEVSLATACELLAVPGDGLPGLVDAVVRVVNGRPQESDEPPHGDAAS